MSTKKLEFFFSSAIDSLLTVPCTLSNVEFFLLIASDKTSYCKKTCVLVYLKSEMNPSFIRGTAQLEVVL